VISKYGNKKPCSDYLFFPENFSQTFVDSIDEAALFRTQPYTILITKA
jgi:hypothetical protein